MNDLVKAAFLPTTRLARGPYLACLGLAGLPVPIVATSGAVAFGKVSGPLSSIWTMALPLAIVIAVWMGFCAMANRLHDIDRSAIWVVTPAVAFAALIAVSSGPDPSWSDVGTLATYWGFFLFPLFWIGFGLILALFPSQTGSNRFGANGEMTIAPRAQGEGPQAAERIVKLAEALGRPNLRLDRRSYFIAGRALGIISMAIMFFATLAVMPLSRMIFPDDPPLRVTMLSLSFTPIGWMTFCLAANRLRDMNYHAAWIFAPIGIYALACAIVSLGDLAILNELTSQTGIVLVLSYVVGSVGLCWIKGSNGANQYGPPTSLHLT